MDQFQTEFEATVSEKEYKQNQDQPCCKKYIDLFKFAADTQKLINYDPSVLQKIEKEEKKTKWGKYVRWLILIVIIICAFVYVVDSNMSLLGQQKKKAVNYNFTSIYNFNMGNNKSNMDTLFNLHHYATFDLVDVTDRMKCVPYGDYKECLK